MQNKESPNSHSQERLEASLEGIRRLLSHLHGEVATLEQSYSQVFHVLRKLESACNLDDLTGLLRRKPFFAQWESMIEECQRLGENCGVLLIDIDHFKRINDSFGHPTGDEVLRQVALMLKQYEAPESGRCFVGRYGGEEFAVAVRGTDAEMLGLAELIRRAAEKMHGRVVPANSSQFPSPVLWRCTLSVGMASARQVGFDGPRLLKAADIALYEAKNRGRNQVRAAS